MPKKAIPAREDIPWPLEHGEWLRREAKREFLIAVRLVETDPSESEEHARKALGIAQSAFHWLENSELEESAHDELHRYGRWTREHFPEGCVLDWTGTRYERRCPVQLAHLKMGFSIGYTGNRLCSICGSDVSECEHIPGQWYDVPGGVNSDGLCRICTEPGCVDHISTETYRTSCIVRVTSGTIHEISIVGKPKMPDARLLARPVNNEALMAHLGPKFELGMRVDCNQCLAGCEGFTEFPAGGHVEQYLPED